MLTAILVDNDPDKCFLLKRTLRREFPFLSVKDFDRTEAALAALRNTSADLLITNGKIGVERGLDFARRANEIKSDLPIVMITLWLELRDAAGQAGVLFAEDGNSAEITEAVSKALGDDRA